MIYYIFINSELSHNGFFCKKGSILFSQPLKSIKNTDVINSCYMDINNSYFGTKEEIFKILYLYVPDNPVIYITSIDLTDNIVFNTKANIKSHKIIIKNI